MTFPSSRNRLQPPPPPKATAFNEDDSDDDNLNALAKSSRPKMRSALPTKPASQPSIITSEDSSKQNETIEGDNEDDEDDYMSMAISESSTPETSFQRLKRQRMESAIRGHPLSKREIEERERLKREIGLSTSLIENENSKKSKGLKMMKAMGFQIGGGLGRKQEGVDSSTEAGGDNGEGSSRPQVSFEPLRPVIKETRSGIGHESDLKRKFGEALLNSLDAAAGEATAKRQDITPETYRNRLRDESLLRRRQAQLYAAQSIAERLVSEDPPPHDDSENGAGEEQWAAVASGKEISELSFAEIKKVNVMYRGILYRRKIADIHKKMRRDFEQNGPERSFIKQPVLPVYKEGQGEFDEDDKLATGGGGGRFNTVETEVEVDAPVSLLYAEGGGDAEGEKDGEVEWDDEELKEWENKDLKERLDEVVGVLRKVWKYCFWCKFRYGSDKEMEEGCPGPAEDDHD